MGLVEEKEAQIGITNGTKRFKGHISKVDFEEIGNLHWKGPIAVFHADPGIKIKIQNNFRSLILRNY